MSMKRDAMMFLEDYARKLSDEIVMLLDRESEDGDAEAGREAKELARRIGNVRKIVAYVSSHEGLPE